MRTWLTGCLAAAMLLVASCGGGTDRTKAHVRLVNASGGYSALNLSIGDTTVATAVPYGGQAGYTDVAVSQTDAELGSPSTAVSLLGQTVSLAKDHYYSMLAYGRSGSAAMLPLDDNNDAAASGKTLVRVINTAPDAGTLDVYLTGAGDSLSSAAPLQGSAAYGALGGYVNINNGTWRLRVTAAGSKTDLRLDVSGIDFGSTGVGTLVITPGRGGVLVNALMLWQQGGITVADNPQARLRVVAGASGGASVSASVGGTALAAGVGSPALTGYSLVTAGAVPVVASASGNTASLSSATLAGGGDYTLMVYGTGAAPVAVLIEDDNGFPSDTTGAKLRLVHGLADVSASLSLSVNYEVMASGVARGGASGYVPVAASTTDQYAVTAAGSSSALVTSASTITFASDGVYTLFMVGDNGTPIDILHKDR